MTKEESNPPKLSYAAALLASPAPSPSPAPAPTPAPVFAPDEAKQRSVAVTTDEDDGFVEVKKKRKPRKEEYQAPQVDLNADGKSVKILVIDAGAIIKGVRLETIGSEFWTIDEVLAEAKDRRAKEFLASFPFEIKTREPSDEAIKEIMRFAKKTGDLSSLSKTDIKLMALAYMFEIEQNGTENIRKEPVPLTQQTQIATTDGSVQIAEQNSTEEEPTETKAEESIETKEDDTKELEEESVETNTTETIDTTNAAEGASSEAGEQNDNVKRLNPWQELAPGNEDDGWITPDNISKFTTDFAIISPTQRINVGCITVDFSMQNVLLQMGLKVISVEGMLVKSVRQWVKKCYACFSICKDASKEFCPKCGLHTLLRISMRVDETGTVRYSELRKPINVRGTKYSIPTPKGGRNNKDLIFAEDQLLLRKQKAGERRAKKQNYFDPDFEFFGDKRETASSNVHFGHGRKNPNVPKRHIGKKNKI